MVGGNKKSAQPAAVPLPLYGVYFKNPDYDPKLWPGHCREIFKSVKYGSLKGVLEVKQGVISARELLKSNPDGQRAMIIHSKAIEMYEKHASEEDWRCTFEEMVFDQLFHRCCETDNEERSDANRNSIGFHSIGDASDPHSCSAPSRQSSIRQETPASQVGDGKSMFYKYRSAKVIADDLDCEYPQPSRKPDLMIGLNVIDASANDCYSNGQSHISAQVVYRLNQELGLVLNPAAGTKKNGLVLPFAIGEAKKAGEDWPTVEQQTALCAAKFLRIQQNLQQSCGILPSDQKTLVWFFGTVGPQWKVYGCISTRERSAERELKWQYRIFELCHVDLRHLEDVVRLFAVIEMISKWAIAFRHENCALVRRLFLRLNSKSPPPILVPTSVSDWVRTSSGQSHSTSMRGQDIGVLALRPSTPANSVQALADNHGSWSDSCEMIVQEDHHGYEHCREQGHPATGADLWLCPVCQEDVAQDEPVCVFCAKSSRPRR